MVQDTFHIAYKNAAQINAQTILPYLRKVAVHECFRRRKANNRYTTFVTTTDELTQDHPEINEALLPEDALHNKERQRQLLLTIDRLPKLQRDMVYLYYYVDIDAQHIANLMNCSVGSVYSVLTRARKAIRQKLEDSDNRTRVLLTKSLVLLPLAALFLAEESTYVAAFAAPTAGALGATGMAITSTSTSTGAIVGYVAACIVAVGLAAGTYMIALQPTQENEPAYIAATPTPAAAAIHTPSTPEPVVHHPPPTEAPTSTTSPVATVPITTAPATTAPAITEPPTPPPTMPTVITSPPAPPPTTPPPTPAIPIDRTAHVLSALAAAQTSDDVAHIIATYDFIFETQMMSFADYVLRFYLRHDLGGTILVGTSIHADGGNYRMQYTHFEVGSIPYSGTALYRWMRN